MGFDGFALDLPARAEAAQSRAITGGVALSLVFAMLIASAAVGQQIVIGLDTDVSWLITVGERVLGGDRLYVDIFELNPPASVLIYLPGILLAHAVAVRPEATIASLMFALAVLSCICAACILVQAELCSRRSLWRLLPLAALLFLLLPGVCFAQREHVAMLTLLPLIAASAARAEGRSVSSSMALLAGLGGGVTICIKPHFLLAALPLFVIPPWRRRSIPGLFHLEAFAAAAIVVVYAATVLISFPEYLSAALPLIDSGYLQARSPLMELVTAPAFLLFLVAAGLTIFMERRRICRTAAMFPLLSGCGFAAAMLIQGKGYPNHLLPAAALALLALGWAVLIERGDEEGERRIVLVSFGLLAASGVFLFAHAKTYPELTRLVRASAPRHPTILVAGSNLAIGHPLTRWVDGRWVGTRGSLWATGTARELLRTTSNAARRRRLGATIAEDRQLWVADLIANRPDIVLEDREGAKWVSRNPDVRQAMRPYRVAGSAEGIAVLVRADSRQR